MPQTARQRFLTTILFTDIVGSTEKAAELGDHEWRALLRRHHEALRREIARFHGREINTAGDGFLATFDDPERAIGCAFAMRDAVRALAVRIRIGIHTGEVVVEDDGSVGGMAVHIAARVMARSSGDDVLVSATVHDLATGGDVGFDDRGTHVLKGVPGEWRLYAVTSVPLRLPALDWGTRIRERLAARWHGRSAAAVAFAAAILFGLTGLYIVVRDRGRTLLPPVAMAGAAEPGIAVLPFAVRDVPSELSPEGLMDLLATNLDGVAGVRAIDSRTVLARWGQRVGGRAAPPLGLQLDVARSSGASYALLGTAVPLGSSVRLRVDLHDARTGRRLGRREVDGPVDAVIPLVDRLTIDVLGLVLEGGGRPGEVGLARITTDSLEALKSYLEGERLLRRSDFEAAIAAFQRAIRIDSGFALAHYHLGAALGWVEGPETALEHFEAAARLARRLPEREAKLVDADLALERGTLEGVPILLDAVRRYPDDPAAWSLLGETYFHLGAQALIPPEEAEAAFLEASALDPGFAPFHEHLVEIAFYRADSAAAAGRIERHGRIAAATPDDAQNRLAFALAFGDSAAQVRARAATDTLAPLGRLFLVRSYLWHPRFRGLAAELLAGRPRPAGAQGEAIGAYLASLRFASGELDEAFALLQDPRLSDTFRSGSLYLAHRVGLPVPAALLDRHLAPGTAPGAEPAVLFYAGAYAADRGRREDHLAAVTALREGAERLAAAGDSTRSRFVDAAALGLEGYGLAVEDEAGGEALDRLVAAQRRATSQGDDRIVVNATLRFWIADLLERRGRLREAERYLAARPAGHYEAAFPLEVAVGPRLAALYEKIGDAASARTAYEAFAFAWRGADPELQPLVREAARAAARLSGSPAGSAPAGGAAARSDEG